MKIRLKLTLVITTLLLFSNCAGFNILTTMGIQPNTHPAGREYSTDGYMGFPIFLWLTRGGSIFHKNSVPGIIGKANSVKSGEACSYSILYLAGFGDSTISDAMNRGGIKKIATIDHQITAILTGVFHKHCTIVTGE